MSNLKESTLNKYRMCVDNLYANGFKQRQAYQSVYTNASDSTAWAEMTRILRLPQIVQYIEQKNEQLREESEFRRLKLRSTLEAWLDADVTQALCLTAEEIKQLPEKVRKLVTNFETSKTTFGNDNGAEGVKETIKIRFVSKEKAAEMLAKHYGMYEAHNEQKNQTVKIVIEDPEGDLD